MFREDAATTYRWALEGKQIQTKHADGERLYYGTLDLEYDSRAYAPQGNRSDEQTSAYMHKALQGEQWLGW